MLSKSFIQFSVYGWGCVPSLLFDLSPSYGGGNEDNGCCCPTLCDPIDSSPPGSSVHGILQARTLEWGAIAFSAIIVWSQVNNREGTQPHPSTENCITDLWSIFLPIRARPSFPLSQSLPSGSFHRPLILLHQRADRLKTTITEN